MIRKCKCKNFVSGLLAHSVIKSQQMATGIAGELLEMGHLTLNHIRIFVHLFLLRLENYFQ